MAVNEQIYDVVIVGGGFAGLSAAIWLGRLRRRALVISSGQSRNQVSHAVHGYPGFEGEDPNIVLGKIRKEALGYGAELVETWVEKAAKTAKYFVVETSGATYRAKRVLLATGTTDSKPDLPGFSEFEGTSIWHCPACDGFEYTGEKLAVVGWGPHIAEYALEFLAYTKHITVLLHGHKADDSTLKRLQPHNIPVHTSPIAKLQGQKGQLDKIVLADGTQVGCRALFYSIEHRPRLELAKQLGCKLDGNCVQIYHQQQTSVKGVYAAGDIAPLEELIVVACAMGAVAASNIHKSLNA